MPTYRERGDSVQAIVRVKQNGQLIHSESRNFPNRKLAEAWAEPLQAKLKKEGVLPRQRAQLTLGELMRQHRQALEEVKPLRRALAHEYDMLEGMIGGWKLDGLTSKRFGDFARERRAAGAGPATVLHNLSTVRSILNAAKPLFGIDVDSTAISEAIAALTRTGHVAKSGQRTRRPTQRELDLLIAEFTRIAPHPSTIIPMATIVQLAVDFPRRLGELCAMAWENYNLPGDPGVIKLIDTKHPSESRDELVPVPPAAQAIINALPRIDARILPYNPESVSAAFQRACERLQIEDLHFHDLRHEGISRLLESGRYTLQDVAMISGHKSWNMLRRYAHLERQKLLGKMSASQ